MATRRGSGHTWLTTFAGVVMLCLSAVDARADAITIVLQDSVRTNLAGGSHFFQGTLTNNTSSAIQITRATLGGSFGAVAGDVTFHNLLSVPLTLGPFQSLTATLFRVDIDTGSPLSEGVTPLMQGAYALFSGTEQTGFQLLGEARFVATTGTIVPAFVPEPAAVILLGAGLAALAAGARRGRRSPAGGGES